jgi:hypothetical protein
MAWKCDNMGFCRDVRQSILTVVNGSTENQVPASGLAPPRVFTDRDFGISAASFDDALALFAAYFSSASTSSPSIDHHQAKQNGKIHDTGFQQFMGESI